MPTLPDRHDPLDYADAQSQPRVSKLAVGLPILAFAACPCCVSIAFRRVEDSVIIHHVWVYRLFLPFGFPLAVIVLGMIAMFRIGHSNGRLIGVAPARFSIGLSVFWIIAWAIFIFILGPLI